MSTVFGKSGIGPKINCPQLEQPPENQFQQKDFHTRQYERKGITFVCVHVLDYFMTSDGAGAKATMGEILEGST